MKRTQAMGHVIASAMLVALMLVGCGGGGGGGDSQGASPTPIGGWSVSGQWRITENASSSDADCAGTATYTLTVTQNGQAISVTDSRGAHYQGTINGSTLTADTVPFSYPDGIGTTTVTALVIIIQSNSSITGSSSWHYSDSSGSCSGTTSISGVKQ